MNKYIFKFDEFIAKLRKNHPRIHAKDITIPFKIFENFENLVITDVNYQRDISFYFWMGCINIKNGWSLDYSYGRDTLSVYYKNQYFEYPLSDLFEPEFNNRLNKLIE